MISISLPNGSTRKFDNPITGLELAKKIAPSLEKDALVIEIDGKLKDLSFPIEQDASVKIITRKSEAALEILRHDAAHVLAMAVQELYPGTQITFGPPTENGFYYDFYRETPFSTEDFPAIEKRMREIVELNLPISREVWNRAAVHKFFTEKGETFKAEWIEELPKGEEITMYRQGDWIDLCRGPHLLSTGKLGKAFKLVKLAGAYWRGDPSRPQLQRIYGTCWRNKKELDQYLLIIEEAKKRDHRKLGQEMELFHLQEEAQGSVFWHPKGWTLYQICKHYMRYRLKQAGYVEVNTPQLVNRALWERSGHWEKFREHMFITEIDSEVQPSGQNEIINDAARVMALKPMNCPCHVQIFRQGIKSYRDLPLRMAEFGSCHRYEPSGALHGLMRVRAFVQDDAHIFCTEQQIKSETKKFIDLLASIYKDFGFKTFTINFADRPLVRAGADGVWDKAEQSLLDATDAAGINVTLNSGEGAFYGPKLEFVLRDAIGRDWQCGTLQVDFVLPDRLGAKFIGEDGKEHKPVILHRAILGSFERFIGILIENFAGRFPLWLAPTQIVVATITSASNEYAIQVKEKFLNAGLRTEIDLRNEKINYKIRTYSQLKVPVIAIIGEKEAEDGNVSLRHLGGKNQEILALEEAVDTLKAEANGPYEANSLN